MSDAEIVIVSGVPRSGTSMMMRMLMAGGLQSVVDEQRPSDADNPHGYFEDVRAKDLERDASWLEEAHGKAVKVISALLRHLPSGHRYRIVFMRRAMAEVVASQAAMLARTGKPVDPTSDARMQVLFERHVASVAAELERRTDVTVLFVDYEEAVADPAAAAARVNVFLGGMLDERAMAAAVEPLLRRQHRRS